MFDSYLRNQFCHKTYFFTFFPMRLAIIAVLAATLLASCSQPKTEAPAPTEPAAVVVETTGATVSAEVMPAMDMATGAEMATGMTEAATGTATEATGAMAPAMN